MIKSNKSVKKTCVKNKNVAKNKKVPIKKGLKETSAKNTKKNSNLTKPTPKLAQKERNKFIHFFSETSGHGFSFSEFFSGQLGG